MENVLVRTSGKETWLELDRASVETTNGWQVSRERMESGSGVDVGLGNRARQDFASGRSRHVALSRGFRHGTLLQSTVTGHCHRVLS